MEFNILVKKRHSSRSFKKKKAHWKDILEAIDSANQGPFAGNHNNLKFLIIENKQTIEKIADHCEQTWISQSGILIVVCSDDTHLENIYGERGRVYSRQQAGAAIQTILLKLVDLGLDSCWVGAYSDDLVRETLKIPQPIQIEAIIPVGYENIKKPKKEKKSLESSLFWEQWNQDKRPTIFKEEKEDYRP